jgi:hypothetical protein
MHRRSGTERTSTLSERCIELGKTEPDSEAETVTYETVGSSSGSANSLQRHCSSRSELSREVQELEVDELQSLEDGDAASTMQVSVCSKLFKQCFSYSV